MKLVERVGIALVSLALSITLIALLSGFFQNHDSAQIVGGSGGPGQHFRDLGNVVLVPGRLRPPYDSNPPTSGPHLLREVTHDLTPLDDDQLLSALAVGDVVLLYGTRRPPPPLIRLAASVAGPFSPALADTGQAVIVSPRPRLRGVLALAWTHMIRVSGPTDPHLQEFASYWLGRGART